MSNPLLARYAEAIFWLARYVERAENLARILDVHETFARDSHGGQNWLSLVQLNSDEEGFFARHDRATADNVIRFYVTDSANPTAIDTAIANARENARTLRPLISTEMWVQLNVFHNQLRELTETDLQPANLTRLFAMIKEGCQTFTGITEGTFYRDEAWLFYRLGRYIERADQTTRLLDTRYEALARAMASGAAPRLSQWYALLRSASGYHAFRRIHSSNVTPVRVAGFLLFNPSFPRSVARCAAEVDAALSELRSRHGLRGGSEAAETVDRLRSLIASVSIEQILNNGLHQFIDYVQMQLIAVTRRLGVGFFGDEPRAEPDEPPLPPWTEQPAQAAPPAGSQGQSQFQVLGR